MTTTGANLPALPATAIEETPWYELINDAPESPEDAMQQDDTILDVMSILRARYENVPGAFWCSQINVIYDSYTPGSVVAPDGCIVLGLKTDAKAIKRNRRSYRIDEWGVPPAFVLEVGSPSTAGRDLGVKRELYARMGVREYWRLDRIGESYPEPLVGESLVDGEYVRLELHTESDGAVWSRSEVLGVDIFCRTITEGISDFQIRDTASGEWLNTLGDEIAARQAAEAQAQAAEAQAQAVRARNRELEAELERLRQQLGQE